MLQLVMHASLHKHVLRCVCIQQQSLIELIMGSSSEQAINQPASHNTEEGFTVNVYTAGPSITGSRPHLPVHTEMKPRHCISHAHLTLSGKLPSHM